MEFRHFKIYKIVYIMKEENKIILSHKIIGLGNTKIIVLHSWMDDAESWNMMIPYLDINKFTYAFIDIRGYGESKKIKGNYDTNEVAKDVFNLVDKLGWNIFNLIGHSMSGMIAQKVALLDIDNRIEKIVLITPVSAAGVPVNEDNLNFFTSIVQDKNTAKMAYGLFTSNKLSDTWAEKRALRHIEVTEREAQLGYLYMWTQENFIEKMTEVNKPFLVISGKNDFPKFNLENQKIAFENFKNVIFFDIESAGHFPMQETPVLLATEIEKFFSLS